MFAHFVSADFGWLEAPDGRSAQRVIRPGKNRDGYFTSDEVLEQANAVMDLCQELWPDSSFMTMQRLMSSVPRMHFLLVKCQRISQKVMGIGWLKPSNGMRIKDAAGNPMKEKIRMADATFNGQPQSLYFADDHLEHPGKFEGMAQILTEWGYANTAKIRAECKGFKCQEPALDCCLRRILYNQPDFQDVPSLLEIACKARGFQLILLPKFHCELNFIEQVWGYAKRLYCLLPRSSREEDLERNALSSLEQVPLVLMCQ